MLSTPTAADAIDTDDYDDDDERQIYDFDKRRRLTCTGDVIVGATPSALRLAEAL